MRIKNIIAGALFACLIFGIQVVGFGQSDEVDNGGSVEGGGIKGKVTIDNKELHVHNVIVLIAQLNRSVMTDEQGAYEFKDVPAGVYTLIARLERMPEVVTRVEVKAGETVTADIILRLSGIRDQVTISATGAEQTAFEAFQGVTALDSTTLLEKPPLSLGDALEHQTGIAKRSSGPGSSRPVIRGFDGDRVLIAQDGIRTGSLSYASGDHGEPINLLSIERVEVVRGPATLLYGSSAIGGLVNAVSGHDSAHKGLRGYFNTVGGTNNGTGGASGGVEGGTEKWLFWANGGGQRAGDYKTPLGDVLNSGLRNYDVSGGGGYYGKKAFLRGGYTYNSNRFGVPFDPAEEDTEVATLDMRRHNARVNAMTNPRLAVVVGGNTSTTSFPMSDLAFVEIGTIAAPLPAVLALNPNSLNFLGSNPGPLNFNVTNTQAGTLSWTATVNRSWLSVTPTSGAAPATVTVSVNTVGLAPGNYNGTITVTAPDATNSPQTVAVTLSVPQPVPPALGINTTCMSFAALAGAANPSPQTLSITNTGGGTLNWNAVVNQPWLSVSPTFGITPSPITVTVNTAALSAGTYNGTISVSAPNVANSPQVVTVTLNVISPNGAGILTVAILVNGSNTQGYNPNSASPGEFQRYPERYLKHLQVPYEIINVATSSPPSNLNQRHLIIAGHRGVTLSQAWRDAIVAAVNAGTGFVNFDWDPQ